MGLLRSKEISLLLIAQEQRNFPFLNGESLSHQSCSISFSPRKVVQRYLNVLPLACQEVVGEVPFQSVLPPGFLTNTTQFLLDLHSAPL